VAVIGGGIVGCACAALMAERGARVRLYEREAIAAGASGRNSGVLQRPADPELAPLFEESFSLYAELDGFPLDPEPSGVLIVSADRQRLRAETAGLGGTWLEGADLVAAEPGLAAGLAGVRLATGHPVPPAAAARGWAARARAAGAELRVGEEAFAAPGGVRTPGGHEPAGAVVIAAGPWSAAAAGLPIPVTALWGAVVEVHLDEPPRHTVEEAGVDAAIAGDEPAGVQDTIAGDEPAGVNDTIADRAGAPVFTAVTHGGATVIGSTFSAERPDADALAPVLLARGARFLPALRGAPVIGARACARPGSPDGRPLLGPFEEVFLATGHGAWGITLGPASARIVADAVLDGRPVPPALAADR
jgi:glycine/D-amino acid oxidase-like deaminating enzyme